MIIKAFLLKLNQISLLNSPLSSISLEEGRLNGNVMVVSAFASRDDGMYDFVGGFGTASFDRASSSKNCKFNLKIVLR